MESNTSKINPNTCISCIPVKRKIPPRVVLRVLAKEDNSHFIVRINYLEMKSGR